MSGLPCAEDSLEDRMRAYGQREPARARELYGDRPLILDRVDLDGKPQERARPAEDQIAARLVPELPLEHRAPLGHGALARLAAHPEAEQGDGCRRIGDARRWRHGPRRLVDRPRLGKLDHDAERLLRVKERLLPAAVGVVPADDAVAGGLGPGTGVHDARHLEGDVMDAGPALGEESVEKARGPERLDDLDAAAALVTIRGPGEDARRPSGVRHAAELAGQERRGIADAGQTDRDVIEEDAVDPAHPPLTRRRPRWPPRGRALCPERSRRGG